MLILFPHRMQPYPVLCGWNQSSSMMKGAIDRDFGELSDDSGVGAQTHDD